MKRLVSIFICSILFIVSLPAFSFAQSSNLKDLEKSDPTLKKLITELKKKGVPEEYIESKLPYKRDMLEDMAKIDGKFIKHQLIKCNLKQENNNEVTPQGSIDPNMLGIDITFWSRNDSAHPTHKDTYTFYGDYDWFGGNPYWTLTDIFGLAWAGNFTIESNSIKYKSTFIDAWWNEHTAGSGLLTVNPNAGFAFDFDLVGSYQQAATRKNLGWCRADVYHYPDATGSANIIAEYFHKSIIPGLPSVSISGNGPSITLSSYTNIDSAVNYTNIDY